MIYIVWRMGYGDGVCDMVYDVWYTAYGVLCMMYEVWGMVYVVWCMVYGGWRMVQGV